MGDNIRHERAIVISSLTVINFKIHELQAVMQSGYAAVQGGISKSSCGHMDALLKNIEAERKVTDSMVSFFQKITSMMESASSSLEMVENNYSVQKVEE